MSTTEEQYRGIAISFHYCYVYARVMVARKHPGNSSSYCNQSLANNKPVRSFYGSLVNLCAN